MRFDRFRAIVGSMFTLDDAGGIAERYAGVDVRLASPLVLAYIGDAYFHLFVRTRLLSFEQSQVHVLSDFAAQIVSAVWQAKAYRAIEERLTERERAIFRRGRNAKRHAPRRASVAEYHASTGFEALLGTLFLEEERERLDEIAEWAFQAIAQGMMEEIAQKRGRRMKKAPLE